MNRSPIKLNIDTYHEAIADYLKDAELYFFLHLCYVFM